MRAAASRRVLSLDALVDAGLAEDLGAGDWTTEWTVGADATGRADVLARAEGVIAGTLPAGRTFERLDPALGLDWRVREGGRVVPGSEVLRVEGRLRSILAAERTALNFLGRLSGIATLASRFVAAVEGTGCRIVDTRKTTPGWRALEKRAAAVGGAGNHRMGLYDMVLIKENHIRAAGGLRPALRAAISRARPSGLAVEVEVGSIAELRVALEERPDRILLDNLSVEELEEAVRTTRAADPPRPELEASGGITLDTVGEVARTGVDLASVGAITHSAPALDLTVLLVDG